VQGLDHLFGRFVPFTDTLAIVDVQATRAPDTGADFGVLHAHPEAIAGIERYRRYFSRPPDRTLLLTLETHGLPFVSQALMRLDSVYFAPVEWAESMPNMNWASTTDQIRWVLRDPASGKENMDIGWTFARDTAIVVRLVNDRHALHGMQHPIHVHGQRFLVLAVNGVPNQNLVWKDTVLVPAGSAVDILLELSNPGRWMLHCHTAEHLTAQMMTSFTVE
jgi:FtsP/CotA-like multicopper oxidase with cupredoxin domain